MGEGFAGEVKRAGDEDFFCVSARCGERVGKIIEDVGAEVFGATGRRALPVSDSTIAANSSGGTARTARIFGRKNRALIGASARMIAAMSLSCKPAKITRRAVFAENAFPGLGQDACACRIVSAINNDAIVPALKSCGPIDRGETARDRIFAQSNIPPRATLQWQARRFVFDVRLRAQSSAVERLPNELKRRVAFGGARANDCFCFRQLWCGDDRNFRL